MDTNRNWGLDWGKKEKVLGFSKFMPKPDTVWLSLECLSLTNIDLFDLEGL